MSKKMAAELVRFGVSIPGDLIGRFDALIAETGYANRSEAIRDLIRNRLVDAAWQAGTGEMIGTFTMVHDHHVHELGDAPTDIQHRRHGAILTTLHIHLDAHLCLEVLVLRGPVEVVKRIADTLSGMRVVRHGKLTVTSTDHLKRHTHSRPRAASDEPPPGGCSRSPTWISAHLARMRVISLIRCNTFCFSCYIFVTRPRRPVLREVTAPCTWRTLCSRRRSAAQCGSPPGSHWRTARRR